MSGWRCEGWGSLGYSDREIVKFCILQADSRAMNKVGALDFVRANFGFFTDLLGRIPCEFTIEGKRGPREQVNIQGSLLPGSRTVHPYGQASRRGRRPGYAFANQPFKDNFESLPLTHFYIER